MVIGLLSVGRILPSARVAQFLVSINYLMATSLMFTGGFQILFTRYISDRLMRSGTIWSYPTSPAL